MKKYIGILTSGGDCPGLNAAIRAVGKAAIVHHDMQIIGFRDGFRGLAENRCLPLDRNALSGILTIGGTILGTSRDKPHKMPIGNKTLDMTDAIVENYHRHHLDALVCLGGGGTQKSAYRLMKQGLNVLTLPKTIDNDVSGTDITFGFDTALSIAAEAIDRLHSTAHSHHRIIVVEIMGHRAGWLALGAGIAGGADVILIPEIPYCIENIGRAILRRSRLGKKFSIVAVAEGAMESTEWQARHALELRKKETDSKKELKEIKKQLNEIWLRHADNTMRLARALEAETGLETRTTILGHVQRGGAPSPADRLLATKLGTACADLIADSHFNVMVASRKDNTEPVPLEEVAGNLKLVPPEHPWIASARRVITCFGDE